MKRRVISIIIAMAVIMAMAVSAFADSYDWAEEPFGLTVAKVVARYIDVVLIKGQDINEEEYAISIVDGSIEGYDLIFTLSDEAIDKLGEKVDDVDMYVWHFNDAGTTVYTIGYLNGDIIWAESDEVNLDNLDF